MTMLDCAQALSACKNNKRPVLLLDTCSLLDILRDPTREKFGPNRARAAQEILHRIESKPPDLTVVLAEQVVNELKDHKEKIKGECDRVLRKLDDSLARVLGVAEAYGATCNGASLLSFTQTNLSTLADKVVDRYISSAIVVKEEHDFVTRASDRVKRGIRPARRGKQSFKDYLITETYLEFGRVAVGDGFSEKMVFLSSNTEDYTDGSKKKLHDDLTSDFCNAGLQFEVDILAVRYGIGIP